MPNTETETEPSSAFEMLHAQRKILRAAATRDTNSAKSLTHVSEQSVFDVQLLLSKLKRTRGNLDKTDQQIIPSYQDQASIANEVDRAMQYQELLSDAIERLDLMVQDQKAAAARAQVVTPPTVAAAVQSVQQPQTQTPAARVKTPKFELTKFSGDPLRWEEFWDDFSCSVDKRTDLTTIDKFKLLKHSLEGEALGVADGYFLTQSNYEEVKSALKDRFGDPQVAIFAHFEALLDLKPASHEIEQLVQTRDRCEAHIRSLQALGLNEDTFGLVFAPILLSKLPRFVRMEMYRKNGSNKWTLTSLRSLLKEEIQARAASDRAFGGHPNGSSSAPKLRFDKAEGRKKLQQPTASALVVQDSSKSQGSRRSWQFVPKCVFCESAHRSWQCTQYKTVDARRQRIKNRCVRCFSTRHWAKDCPSTKVCIHCRKLDHNSSLCPDFPPNTQTGQGLLVQELNPQAPEFVPVTGGHLQVQLEPGSFELKGNSPGSSGVSEPVNTMCGSDFKGGRRGRAVLESAVVTVKGQSSWAKARIVFDSGSTLSFVRSRLRKEVGAKIGDNAVTSVGRFGDVSGQSHVFPIVRLEVCLRDGSSMSLCLREVSSVSTPIRLAPLNIRELSQWVDESELAEMLVNETATAEIDILIGLDYYYDIVGPQQWRCSNGLVVKQTAVGKVVTGFLRDDSVPSGSDAEHQMLIVDQRERELYDLERFWRLEDIGVTDPPSLKDDEAALRHFNETVRVKGGRYEVQWPFKTENPELPENYALSLQRLRSVHRKLEKDEGLLKAYDSIFQDQLAKAVIEEAPKNPQGIVHYLPHHAVITPGKETTKVRVVFDASARAGSNALSLNDCMYRGPVFLNDLVGMLMRFRLAPVAVVSDVEKAFLQIALQVEHRDCTRFLWLKEPHLPITPNNLVVFRYARVVFGMKPSPFLLAGVIIHHAQRVGSEVSLDVKGNTYMDNVFSARQDTADALKYYHEAKDLFNRISMNLREWYSNDEKFCAALPSADQGKSQNPSFLGLKWQTKEDVVRCTGSVSVDASRLATKRSILKTIASVYDPCGWFSPVTVRGKMLMQDLWKAKKEWDESVDPAVQQLWIQLAAEMNGMLQVAIPRKIMGQVVVEAVERRELHAFCDASRKAYAACIYLRVKTGNTFLSELIFAKVRVAPVKELTVPRLELMAVRLGARMQSFVEKELRLPIDSVHLWTDSTAVLGWLHSENVTTTFVQNRIREIRNHDKIEFGHVSSGQNPADLPSRGVGWQALADSKLWWYGPHWLQGEKNGWPKQSRSYAPPVVEPEVTQLVLAPQHKDNGEIIDPSRYSKFHRLVRVTAYVLRAAECFRTRSRSEGCLTAGELAIATDFWVRKCQEKAFPGMLSKNQSLAERNLQKQLCVFRDTDGLLRCQGRFQNSANLSEETRLPKLLPSNDEFTKLLIERSHRAVFHSGVKHTLAQIRKEFWIPKGRSTVKKIISRCTICRRNFGGPFPTPKVAPLPDFRSSMARPFACVGLDYFGPLFVKKDDGQQKVWVALYTCSVVRAVHLEVVNSMSAVDFLLSFRRFMAMYGKPDLVVSDNAKQFKLAEESLTKLWHSVQKSGTVQDFVSSQGIAWKFITEKAPWFGGFYERLVGLVKKAMKASLGRWSYTISELQTLLYEIAFVLNSRPLVYCDEEPADRVLTPNHLMLRSAESFPETGDMDGIVARVQTADELLQHWRAGQTLLREFWDDWRDQYLVSLRESWRPGRDIGASTIPAEIGCVVLVKDSNLPRGMWRIGRISGLRPSKDGIVRTVQVTLPNRSTILRPVRLLYPIESSCGAKERSVSGEASGSAGLGDTRTQNNGQGERTRRPQRRAALQAREKARACMA